MFDDFKVRPLIARDQRRLQKFERKRAESESFNLGVIAVRIESDDDFQPCAWRADAPQIAQRRFVAERQRPQQASPRKMRVDLIGHAVKLRGQVFDRRLYEENVRRSALHRVAMDLLGDLLQRARLRVYSDVEPIRVSPRGLVYIVPVARPQVYDHASAGKGR